MNLDWTFDDALFEEENFVYSIFFWYCDKRSSSNTLWGDGFFKYFKKPETTLKGDVNGDGVVDMVDITRTVQALLAPQTDVFFLNNADMDDSENINEKDLQKIVEKILGK